MFKRVNKVGVMGLILAIVMIQPTSVFAQEVTGNKDETVYMSLQANGRLMKTTVVNSFESVNQAVLDYGDYENVINLTSYEAPIIDADQVTFNLEADETSRFYYQGDLKNAVNPWVIDIVYELDGKQVEAASLAGQSGHLVMKLDVKQNPLARVDFANTYTLQLTAVLSAEVTSHLTVKGASVVTIGSNQQVVMTVLPNQSKHVEIEADINAFRMEAITAVGTLSNFDMDIDTAEIAEGFEKLLKGSDELLLGMNQFQDGLNQSAEAVSAFKINLDKLNQSKTELAAGSGEISKGLATLDAGGKELSGAANALSTQLQSASESEVELTQLATSMLQNPDPNVQALAKATLAQIEMGKQTRAAISEINTGLTTYTQSVSGITQAHKSFDAGLIKFNQGIGDYAVAYGRFNTSFKEIPTQFSQLVNGQSELNSGISTAYDTLTSMLDALPIPEDGDTTAVRSFTNDKNTPDSVQFVMKTPSIDYEIVKDIVPVKVEKQTFWDRVKALFSR